MAEEAKKEDASDSSDCIFYYHKGFGGRGTIVRFALELAGIKYNEGTREEGAKHKGADIKGFMPNFAFPVLKIDGSLLSQTPSICTYVLGKSGFSPKDLMKQSQANQVALTAADLWSEWFGGYGGGDVKDKWIKGRGYKFLEVLENQLKQNNEGKGFYFDDKPCIADIFVADILRRFKYINPELYKTCKYELLKQHTTRFEEYPQIKQFLESDRYKTTIGQQKSGKMGFLAL